MVEPTACAVHGALWRPATSAVPSLSSSGPAPSGCARSPPSDRLSLPGTIIIGAKYPEQRRLARELGATVVAEPGEVRRAVRRSTRSLVIGDRLAGGADVVIDCVGSAASLDRGARRGPAPGADRHGRHAGPRCPSTSPRSGSGRSSSWAPTPTATRRASGGGTFDVAMELVHDAGLAPAGVGAVPARPVTSTPSTTPPTPAGGVRSRSSSISARNRRRRAQTRRGLAFASMPRPGFVLEVDRSTPPTLMWHGEGFRLERLPVGSAGSIYAPEPLDALEDPDGADPPRPAPPGRRQRPAAGSAATRDAADHRLRRHQPAAAADAGTRRPPAGHRSRPRPRRRGRRRRRRAHRRPRAAPPDDRAGAPPRPRRPGLRRLRPARPAAAARRRGPEPTSSTSASPTRARTSRSTSGRPSRTCWSTSTSTSSPWTAATSRWRPAWRPTRACATTTTCGRCSTAARSWTSTGRSCTAPTGAWAG